MGIQASKGAAASLIHLDTITCRGPSDPQASGCKRLDRFDCSSGLVVKVADSGLVLMSVYAYIRAEYLLHHVMISRRDLIFCQ